MASGADHKTKSLDPVLLDAKKEADRTIVLTPEDEDRFVKSCEWVVEASKLVISRDLFLRELHIVLSYVREWMSQRSSVKACYAAYRDDQVAIYVIPSIGRYDFELSKQLTELDIELAQKHQVVPCDVMQAPDLELEDLSDPRLIYLVYEHKEASEASSQVAAQS